MSRLIGVVCVLVLGSGLSLAVPAQADRESQRVVIGPAGADALQVMSFNLRYASDDGPNSWPARRPVLTGLLRAERPTVIGTQEGLYEQLTDIDRELPGYAWLGVGRDGGHRGEFMAVFYDVLRLKPLRYGHFWLSDTPDVVGSATWGNVLPRMVTWVDFADLRTGAEFVLLNTHFDQRSEHARIRAAELVRDRVAAISADLPVVITGDFNAPAGASPAYDILTGAGLNDAWLTAAAHNTPLVATFHGFAGPAPGGPRIDWILTRGPVTVHTAGINTYARHGQFPSDHFPTQALITLGGAD